MNQENLEQRLEQFHDRVRVLVNMLGLDADTGQYDFCLAHYLTDTVQNLVEMEQRNRQLRKLGNYATQLEEDQDDKATSPISFEGIVVNASGAKYNRFLCKCGNNISLPITNEEDDIYTVHCPDCGISDIVRVKEVGIKIPAKQIKNPHSFTVIGTGIEGVSILCTCGTHSTVTDSEEIRCPRCGTNQLSCDCATKELTEQEKKTGRVLDPLTEPNVPVIDITDKPSKYDTTFKVRCSCGRHFRIVRPFTVETSVLCPSCSCKNKSITLIKANTEAVEEEKECSAVKEFRESLNSNTVNAPKHKGTKNTIKSNKCP